ncbi:MAG: rubrerythrin subfamily [Nitrospirae bacterium]|nr:MAG: rubrerythrin subfamily [Nitrospirota bacterium]
MAFFREEIMNSVEISVKMESDAVEFYTKCAEKVQNPVGKKMFLSIAEDEKRHIELLGKLLKKLDMTVEKASPIKAIQSIFAEMKDAMVSRIAATTDEMEAFRVAMEMEKQGRDFYRKSASDAPTPLEKKLFETLAEEEEEHFRVFSNTFEFMQNNSGWYLWEERGVIEG